jgi:hypothetical protein
LAEAEAKIAELNTKLLS